MREQQFSWKHASLLCICLSVSLLAAIAWIVNVDVALKDLELLTTGIHLEDVFPAILYKYFAVLAKDLTTCSPLLILATFAFPLFIWSLPRIRRGKALPASIAEGYPRRWFVFVIYVGLAATLAGMVIALAAVESKTELPGTGTLTRLIGGTATALVSSLVALIAAFCSYVLQVSMERLGMVPTEDKVKLADRLRELLETFRNLQASLRALPDPLRVLRSTVFELKSELDKVRTALEPYRDQLGQFFGKISDIATSTAKSLEIQGEQLNTQRSQLEVERQQLAVQSEKLQEQIQLLTASGEDGETRSEQLQLLEQVLRDQRETLAVLKGQNETYVSLQQQALEVQQGMLTHLEQRNEEFARLQERTLEAMQQTLENQRETAGHMRNVAVRCEQFVDLAENEHREAKAERAANLAAAQTFSNKLNSRSPLPRVLDNPPKMMDGGTSSDN